MDVIPDNQPSRNTFDVFLRTTKPQPLPSVSHNIKSLLWGRKKLLLLPAAGILAISVPIALADNASNSSHNRGSSNTSSPSQSSNANSQNIQFQQKSTSTGVSTQHDSSLTINGQSIPVPKNGHLEQTFSDGTQSTTVQMDTHNEQNSANGNNSNTSSSSVNIRSTNSNESRGSP